MCILEHFRQLLPYYNNTFKLCNNSFLPCLNIKIMDPFALQSTNRPFLQIQLKHNPLKHTNMPHNESTREDLF